MWTGEAMAKATGRLTGKLKAVQVAGLVAAGKPGAHADGGNLYLRVAGVDAGKWTLRYMIGGKSREMGLGPYDADGKAGLTLAQARAAAEGPRAMLRASQDPIAERERREAEEAAAARAAAEVEAAATRTFEAAARALVETKRAGWRSAKHAAQWLATLEQHAFPTIGAKPIATIGTDDVLAVLRPIWDRTPETASRLRQRIEAVLDDARVQGWRLETLANPARWKGHLSASLPSPRKVREVQHHPSLPWQQMAAFMGALAERSGMAAKALRFAILTGARTGAVRLMRWREIDLEAAIWTAPGANMKTKKSHRTPLSPAALALLDEVRPPMKAPTDLVFPGGREGRPLSDMALSMLVRGMACDGLAEHEPPRWRDIEGRPVVPHGFRATFKGWSLAAGFPDPLSELALAHADKDKVRAAYAREDMCDQRRPMMDAWAEHCAKVPATPASLAAARARRAKG